MNIVKDQEEFMLRSKQTVASYNGKQVELYYGLIAEEVTEFADSIVDNEPLENKVKQCIDIIVACLGYLFSLGVNPLEAWKLVWANNIAKVSEAVIKDPVSGKIQKSDASKARKVQMMKELKGLVNP